MKLGLHVATAGDFLGVPKRARQAGGTVAQIFAGNPRGWQQTTYDEQTAQAFKDACQEHGIETFIHMMYLTNYATANDELRNKSIAAMRTMLATGEQLSCAGVVTHLGSHKGLDLEAGLKRTGEAILETLDDSSRSVAILENSAGAGETVGDTIEELATIYEHTGQHSRVKFCLDTAHAFACGYDIRDQAGWTSFLDAFDRAIGLKHVVLLHLNDSKVGLNEKKDRHENIGDGYIGADAFQAIVNEPRLRDTPGVLEVPGLDGKGPDKANLDRLKDLVK